MDKYQLIQRKTDLEQQFDTDTIKILQLYVEKNRLDLTNEEVAGTVGKSRDSLQRLLRNTTAKEYISVCKEFLELQTEGKGAELQELNSWEVFAQVRELLYTRALAGEPKAMDMLLRHHAVLDAIEERKQQEMDNWKVTTENIEALMKELDETDRDSRRSKGYSFKAPDDVLLYVAILVEAMNSVKECVESIPTDELYRVERQEAKGFYFEITNIVAPLLNSYGVVKTDLKML